jgi:CHAT domain-containing protein
MQVHSNLAAAYMETASAEPGTWQKALDHIQRVLEATDREQSPYFWAHSKRNLAAAYANAPPQRSRTHTTDAIAALQEALEVFTLDTYPADHRLTQGYLGHLYFLQRKWQDGLCAYQASMKAGERLLATAYTEIGRRTEVSETSLSYSRAAYCLLELDRPAEALVQLEAGKARLLSEALAMTDADLAMLPDAQQKDMREARRRVRELEAEMRLPPETPARRNDRELAQLLHQTRTRIRDLIHAIRQDHLDFMPTGLDLSGILGLIPKGGALVAPVVTSQGSAIFVLPDGTESIESDHVISLADFTDGDLRELLLGREDDARWDGWMRAYFALFGNRERAPLEGWWAAIEAVTQRVWDQLIAPVHERLQALGLSQDAPVILMPQGGLGLLPLHAAWRTVDGTKRTFLDDYTVSYAPSAYALSVARHRMEDPLRHDRSLLAVVNPTGDLRHATGEGRAVAAHFEPGAQTVLVGGEATQAAVVTQARGRCYLHFSCHGFYHWQNPMASGLLLASSDPATVTNAFELREILSPRFDLSAARLVTLSACETGLTEFQQSPDEYIGLPSGFLQAGAPAVVSSLWAVDDLSTALLMGEFYRRHLADRQEPAVALRGAQLWLRAATAEELKLAQRYEELYRASGRRDAEVLRRIRYYRAHPKVVPFAQAYYWAGFIFSGA